MIIDLSIPRKMITNTIDKLLFELKLNPPKLLNRNDKTLLLLSLFIISTNIPLETKAYNAILLKTVNENNYDKFAPTILTIGELLKHGNTLLLSLKCLLNKNRQFKM